jgi:predicted ATPase
MHTIRIDCTTITDWDSFHDVFAEAFGFPSTYGRNLDAWVDCVSDLDDSSAGTSVRLAPGSVLALVLDDAETLRSECPDIFDALLDSAAFVNWRRIEAGQPALLALAYTD